MATPASVKSKIQNLIDSANQVTGASDTTLTDAVSRLLQSASATRVNGVIKQYKVEAGASVSVGDFVEFIEHWGSGKISKYKSGAVSAVALSDSRVLVAYGDTNDGYGRAVVLSVDGSTVTIGEPYIFNSAKTDESISAVAIGDNQVLVAYQDGGSNNGVAVVLSVDGLTVTTGTSVVFHTGKVAEVAAAHLGNGKVFLVYREAGNTGRAQVLIASGASITTSTETHFDSNVKEPKVAVLSESKVLVMYQTFDWGANTALYGQAMAMTISGSTISRGAAHTFRNAPVAHLALVALNDTKALGVFQNTSSSKQLVAILFSVTDRTTTSGGSIVLNTTAGGSYSGIARIGTNKVLVVADFQSTQHDAKAQVLTINDWNISPWPAVTFLTYANADAISHPNLLALSESNILLVSNEGISRGTNYRGLTISGNTITAEATDVAGGTSVKPATSNKYNVGVAKTSGAEGETVEVYRAV